LAPYPDVAQARMRQEHSEATGVSGTGAAAIDLARRR
jgi:hypothetical protein